MGISWTDTDEMMWCQNLLWSNLCWSVLACTVLGCAGLGWGGGDQNGLSVGAATRLPSSSVLFSLLLYI
jgi:hypothetical protein